MFEITTKEDVVLLKEMLKGLTETESTKQIDSLENAISTMNKQIAEQTESTLKVQKSLLEAILNIRKQTDEQAKILSNIQKTIETTQTQQIKKETKIIKKNKNKETRYLQHEDVFAPYKASQILYNNIELDEIRLIHYTNKSQQYALPVNIFELICIVEEYKQNNYLTVERVNFLCNEFEISKPQFSKIYYNILEKKFDKVLKQLDKIILTSLFTIEDGFIYRNDKNTNISIEEFKHMYNDYINSEKPFFKLYEIIKDSTDYNALDVFILLRKNDVLLRIIQD